MVDFEVIVDRELLTVADDLRDFQKDALRFALERTIKKLGNISPEGVTGELKENWEYEIEEYDATIRNTASNSLFRMVGRGPGKPPPTSAIASWARSKGINPFVLSKAIGEKGTKRWRDKDNPLKLLRNHKLKGDSPARTVADILKKEMDKFKV